MFSKTKIVVVACALVIGGGAGAVYLAGNRAPDTSGTGLVQPGIPDPRPEGREVKPLFDESQTFHILTITHGDSLTREDVRVMLAPPLDRWADVSPQRKKDILFLFGRTSPTTLIAVNAEWKAAAGADPVVGLLREALPDLSGPSFVQPIRNEMSDHKLLKTVSIETLDELLAVAGSSIYDDFLAVESLFTRCCLEDSTFETRALTVLYRGAGSTQRRDLEPLYLIVREAQLNGALSLAKLNALIQFVEQKSVPADWSQSGRDAILAALVKCRSRYD